MDLADQRGENSRKGQKGPNDFFEKSKRNRGRVKHELLRYYLGAYLGILGQSKSSSIKTIIYVDGFAGPGSYQKEDGTSEDGSPLVALKSAVKHRLHDNFVNPIKMIFIDNNQKNIENLEKTLRDY